MAAKKSRRRRVLRWLLIVLVVLFIVLFVVAPLVMAYIVTAGNRRDVGETPSGFQDVTFTTSDGVDLAGWYAAPQNGAAIILIHGASGSRESMRAQAVMLAEHGYGVLAFDLRGHGGSDGQTNRYGWQGTRDVGGAVAFLEEQEGVDVIGGWGSSLGGEVLLGAMSAYPAVRAVLSDGASYRSFDEFYELPMQHQNVFLGSIWLMFQWVGVFSGDEPPTPIIDSIRDSESTPLLLIAGGDKKSEVKYNEMFAEAAGDRAELWVVPGVGHTQAFGHNRDEYEQRAIAFFDAALLEPES